MNKDSQLIVSSNLINGLGYFIFTSLFLILFVKEGFNTVIYSVIYASSLIIEAVVLFFNPRIINRLGLKYSAILFYIIPGIGIFLSVSFNELPLIWFGYILFIVGGAGWAPLATMISKISSEETFTKNLVNLISTSIRIGYIIGGILTFAAVFLDNYLRITLTVSSLIVVISGLPLIFLRRYESGEITTSIGIKSIFKSLGYGAISQLTFIFVPLLPLFLYDRKILIYFIPLFLLFRYFGAIVIGRAISTKFDHNKNFVLLIQFVLLVSVLLFLLPYWYTILIALFLIGIGGMNHNFYFSIYARENREISSSSAFSIGVLISSALLILTGGYVYSISIFLLLIILIIALAIAMIISYFLIEPNRNKNVSIPL
jgi:MFS family permease